VYSFVGLFSADINFGATWDERLAFETGQAMGFESRDKDITVTLGPDAGALGRVSPSVHLRNLTLMYNNLGSCEWQ
jgi:hypothetical protein